MKYLFVGECRSDKAIAMNVTWQDGRLAAKQLFDALQAIGIKISDCAFTNWFDNDPNIVRKNTTHRIVGMGRKVQQALDAENIPHLKLIHPAARGSIRKKSNYIKHAKSILL